MKNAVKLGKDPHFSKLVLEVQACRQCPRMCDSARVLSFAAGNLNAAVLFIGEAPGRLGADQTEIPFHGDVSGNNFEGLLAFAGLSRDAVFVTNAAICNLRTRTETTLRPQSKSFRTVQPFSGDRLSWLIQSLWSRLGLPHFGRPNRSRHMALVSPVMSELRTLGSAG